MLCAPMPLTAADLCIQTLALDVSALEADVVTYRAIVQAALGQLHEAECREIAAACQLQALRNELRRYTSARVTPCP